MPHHFAFVETSSEGLKENGSYLVENMCGEENWNVPVLWEVVISHSNDVLRPHNILYHVNPLGIDSATTFSICGD